MQKIITIILIISLFSCSKKEEAAKEIAKGFELSNTMLKSTTFAKAEKKDIEDEEFPKSKINSRISQSENQMALAIPSDAVIFDDNRYFVVVYKSQTDIKVKEIRILKQNSQYTYITSGLSEGETIVTNNQLLIYRSLNN